MSITHQRIVSAYNAPKQRQKAAKNKGEKRQMLWVKNENREKEKKEIE